jgi:Ca2+-transporting ATPase
LEHELSQLPGVKLVSASPFTSNVLVLFDSPQTVATITAQVKRVATRTRGERANPTHSISSSIAEQKRSWSRRLNNGNNENNGQPIPARHPEDAWHLMETGAALATLQSSAATGLSEREARERLRKDGPNSLPETERRSGLSIVLDQVSSWPVGLLAVAAGISVATGGIADAIAIAGVIAINATIGYVTESQSERAIQSLKGLSTPTALVYRAGHVAEIDARDVVRGDILVLTAGCHVPADARVIEAHDLTTDESALTGESMPVSKSPARLYQDAALSDRSNMVYGGTLVTGGRGVAVAIATGRATEIGAIQTMASEARPPQTPMERQLTVLGNQQALICGGVCAGVLATGLLRGYGFLEMLKSSLALAVAAVPEGLPTVAATTLVLGIRNMRRQNVLIRRLEAVESLGRIQTICLDKTGTLTLNHMTASAAHCGMRRLSMNADSFFQDAARIDPLACGEFIRLAQTCVLCSEAEISKDGDEYVVKGSPTENALIHMAIAAGIDVQELREQCRRLKLNGRAADRYFMSTLHRVDSELRGQSVTALGHWNPDGAQVREGPTYLLAVKGSPSEVLGMCGWYFKDGERIPLTDTDREAIRSENDRMAGDALRVLGCAYGEPQSEQDAVERDLTWLGLVGMADPIRSGVREVIAGFHAAGIDTVMITGDQAPTAYAIGRELALSRNGSLEIVDSSHPANNGHERIYSQAEKVHIFARISPASKLEIVQALQRAGRVVAMTGDGINDGPALRAADVGIAMGNGGTELARETSDVILQDNDLQTMLIAIRQGRTIHRNVRKSLHFLLSTNFSEIMVMFAGIAAGLGQPLNAMQLLWINLISDVFPGLALALEPPEADVMNEPPADPRQPIVSAADFIRITGESASLSAGALSAYAYGLLRYGTGPRASTLAFTSLTSGQLMHALNCRSERNGVFGTANRPANYYLTGALAASLSAQSLTLALPSLRSLLGLSPLSVVDLAVAAGSIAVPFLFNRASKGKKPNRMPAQAVAFSAAGPTT